MKRSRIVVPFFVLLLVVLLASCATGQDLVRTIEVNGTAKVTVTPDIATFSIQVSEMGKTTAEAQMLANEKMAQLRAVLDAFGIAEEDIKTTSLNLRPSYRWDEGEQILEGQVASQSLSVKVRDLASLGSIIDQMGNVSGIYLNSIQLDKEDKSIALEEARMEAIRNAFQKATLYAESSSMQVGSPITISEYSIASNPYTTRMKLEATSAVAYDMATEIPAGTMEVSSTVSIVYEMY
ncbi:MAG: SIMPL domain-containing protein [Sphaerochaetaceae bacterium]